MCTTVYVGSDLPIQPDKTPVPNGTIVLATADRHPAALKHLPYVGMIVNWFNGRTGCSCDFHDESLPWDPQDEEPRDNRRFRPTSRMCRDAYRQRRDTPCSSVPGPITKTTRLA